MLNVDGYGRVASDIPVRKSKNSKHMYTNFLLASHDNKKNTTFIRCVAFDGMAVLLNEHVSRGDRIMVKGDLIADSYHTKGSKFSFELRVNGFEFVETVSDHNVNKAKSEAREKKKKLKNRREATTND